MRTVSLVLAGFILSLICIGWAGVGHADPSLPEQIQDSSSGLQVDPLLGGDLYTKAVRVANCGDASAQCDQQPDGAPCGPPSLSCACLVIVQPSVHRCVLQ